MKPSYYSQLLPENLKDHTSCIVEVTEDDTDICHWTWTDVESMIKLSIYDTIAIWRIKPKQK